MRLLLGTNNNGKIVEIGEALAGLPLTLLTPGQYSITAMPDETGTTFSENALQKSRFYYSHSQLPTIADDSGIMIEALKDELGIHTRRWGAGKDASDEEWIHYFLKRMERESNRNARFVCSLAYIDRDGEHLFEGICDGVITPTLEAEYLPGLPISACFKPHGHDLVYSAMSTVQKNSSSHRGKALGAFRKFLEAKVL